MDNCFLTYHNIPKIKTNINPKSAVPKIIKFYLFIFFFCKYIILTTFRWTIYSHWKYDCIGFYDNAFSQYHGKKPGTYLFASTFYAIATFLYYNLVKSGIVFI